MDSSLSDFRASPSLPLTLFFSNAPPLPPQKRLHQSNKEGKSPPLSKRENPLVTHERNMSAWQVDGPISPHLTVKWSLREQRQPDLGSGERRGSRAAAWRRSANLQNANLFAVVSPSAATVAASLFPFLVMKNSHGWRSWAVALANVLIFEDEAVFSFWMNHSLHGLLCSHSLLFHFQISDLLSQICPPPQLSHPPPSFFPSSPTVFSALRVPRSDLHLNGNGFLKITGLG